MTRSLTPETPPPATPLGVRGAWVVTSIVAIALLAGCGYERSVSDEFNGPAGPPNTYKWGSKTYCNFYSAPPSYWKGDVSQACNVPSQARVDGYGHLRIRATYTTQGGYPHWLSAHLASKTKLTPPYVVAVRAKVAPGAGMWSSPAWTTSSRENGGCAEVDVLEQLGRQPFGVNQSLHNWCGTHRYVTRYSNVSGTPLANGFHVYAAVVKADHVEYYVDQRKTATIWGSQVRTGMATPSTFHISLNVGTCGSWAGCPPQGAPSPVEMVVDWFRVYGLPY
jgi:beta-glucanase (GH16 family)